MIRRVAGLLLVLTIALLVIPRGLSGMGTWLVVEDPLEHARSVVVLGGQLPFRAMEAARTYQQGWTKEVWVTQGAASEEDAALARLGINKPTDSDYSRQVLKRLGVPDRAVRTLPEHSVNTADELRAIAKELQLAGGDRVILVTSRYHTRRVRALWHLLVGDRPEAVVRYTPDDPFDAEQWWRNSRDAMAVSREWFGLLNAWIGFPVKSQP